MEQVINLLLQKGFEPKGETQRWYGNWKPVLNIRKRFMFHSNYRERVTVGKLTTYFYKMTREHGVWQIGKFKTKDIEGINNFLDSRSSSSY
jgi:hypothetical protein